MIKEKLDQYLEFDSNLIFNPGPSGLTVSRLTRIFGGAIRDIISEQPIHDIDILCGSRSYYVLKNILESKGYTYMDDLIHKDLGSLYRHINVINEPHTWIKGSKIVQVIRPVIRNFPKRGTHPTQNEKIYKDGFTNLIRNVDISCCGVSWDGTTLFENYPSAILNCLTKTFKINKSALMYSPERISQRKYKLESRGWVELNDVSIERDLKISVLLDEKISKYQCVKEYKSDDKTEKDYISVFHGEIPTF